MVYSFLLQMAYLCSRFLGVYAILWEGYPVYFEMFSSISSLYPQDANSQSYSLPPPAITNKNIFRHYQMFPLEHFLWLRTTGLDNPGPFGLYYYIGRKN